jgi:hypothetical protein
MTRHRVNSFNDIGWVYDLFRPDEPYSARGIHPSGTGINRYRKTTDLTDEELSYLHAQRYWYIFNYVSPMLFNVNRITIGDAGLYGNFAFRHFLTSFGTDTLLKTFLKKKIYITWRLSCIIIAVTNIGFRQ